MSTSPVKTRSRSPSWSRSASSASASSGSSPPTKRCSVQRPSASWRTHEACSPVAIVRCFAGAELNAASTRPSSSRSPQKARPRRSWSTVAASIVQRPPGAERTRRRSTTPSAGQWSVATKSSVPSPFRSAAGCRSSTSKGAAATPSTGIGLAAANGAPDGRGAGTGDAGAITTASPSAPMRVYLNSARRLRGLPDWRRNSSRASAASASRPCRPSTRLRPSHALRRYGSSSAARR